MWTAWARYSSDALFEALFVEEWADEGVRAARTLYAHKSPYSITIHSIHHWCLPLESQPARLGTWSNAIPSLSLHVHCRAYFS